MIQKKQRSTYTRVYIYKIYNIYTEKATSISRKIFEKSTIIMVVFLIRNTKICFHKVFEF